MSLGRRLLSAVVVCSLFLPAFLAISAPLHAQERPTPLVTQTIDDAHLATLPGSVHPLANARYDQGPVSESAPAGRILILLHRPPDREAAFQQYLKAEHTPGSPLYHHWLTPAQIAAQFGPADSDIQAVSSWLNGSGFSVNRVSKARSFIEFSGTVGELNAAFHTRIDQYLIDGVTHHANATPLRIPQALSPAIAAVSPLDDFRLTSQLQTAGRDSWSSLDRRFEPDLTGPPSWSPLQYALAPADFATQYDLAPLSSAGVTGSGVTIGIIDESNIDLSLPADYRSVFGLPANPVQVIVDGQDPGWNPSEGETYLDVEIAGAVAPAATIDLYISNGSPYQDPIALASLRAVDDDQADIISVSWGGGEEDMTPAETQIWNALWEQAAAQGQTVLVATGDYGQSPDDYFQFLSVNAVASTPWDVAVGGTDFYYSDYASGAPSSADDWNATNDPTTKGSLKAPLPEQVWNDPFGLDAIDGLSRGEIYAGGGGASSCITRDATSNVCTGGYPKPAWQTGSGVPTDGVRDVPDVALFASNGANLSAYADCDYEGACTPDASGNFDVDLVGGTSASAPAMAGVMALVDQKYGRQGQADAVLYPLAQQKPSAFHDITLGGNWDICELGAPDCDLGVDGLGADTGESTVYAAGPGYDLASGLGSLDIANLVNNWSSISFTSTSTSLQLSPATIQHGKNVTISAAVRPSSGSGIPTGAVSVLTTSDEPASRSQAAITLTGGSGSDTLSSLPGGTYQITGQYGGDNTYAGSTSSPQTLTVNPEKSTLTFNIVPDFGASLTALVYGEGVTLNAQPVGVNAPSGQTDGAATGSVTFTLDSNTTSEPLNAGGIASWSTPILSVGPHTASASYAGDNSFKASSTAQPVSFTVGKGYTTTTLYPSQLYSPYVSQTINAGSSVTVSAQVQGYSTFPGNEAALGTAPVGMQPPTGTLTVGLAAYNAGTWTVAYSQTATVTPAPGFYGAVLSFAQVTFPNLAAGQYTLIADYSGDANYQSFSCTDYVECVGLGQFTVVTPTGTPAASTTTLAITPSSISGDQAATLTATVSGPAGATVAPTGYVSLYANGSAIGFGYATLGTLTAATSGPASTFSIALPPDYFPIDGQNQVTAVYTGDTNYMGSASAAVPVTVAQTGSDFTLSPGIPQINVVSGNTTSTTFTMTSLYNFNGAVGLSCTPSAGTFSCSITPSSLTVDGTATANLTITAVNPNASTSQVRSLGPRGAAAFALALVLFVPLRRRRCRIPAGLLLLAIVAFAASGCGSNGGSGTKPPPVNPNGTPAGTYNVLVTGTSGGITHDVKLNVVVTAQS